MTTTNQIFLNKETLFYNTLVKDWGFKVLSFLCGDDKAHKWRFKAMRALFHTPA